MTATDDSAPAEQTPEERLDLCGYLDTLTPDEWVVQSLCPGWSVKDVVAHLTTSTRTTWKDIALGMIRARGDFDRMELTRAQTISRQFSPHELIDRIRRSAGSSVRAPFSSPLDPLVDILVHGQDIARPLGHLRPMNIDTATAALNHVVTSRWYGARARLAGLRILATDSDWSSGSGDMTIEGPTTDLLLVATGRAVGLATLTGPGVQQLTMRLG